MSTTGELSTGAEVNYVLSDEVDQEMSSALLAYCREIALYDDCTVIYTDELATIELEYGTKQNTYITEDEAELNRSMFDNQFFDIWYSNNQIASIIENCQLPFNAIKCDMRPTSDNVLVLCHDEGFTLDGNGDITTYNSQNQTLIRSLTYAQVAELKYASTQQPVGTLEQALRVFKQYGKIPYLTVRNQYLADVIPELIRLLKKYNYLRKCIINCVGLDAINELHAIEPGVMMCYTRNLFSPNTFTEKDIDIADSLDNAMFGMYCIGDSTTPVQDVETYLAANESVINYAHEKGVRLIAGVCGSNHFETLLKYGITGAQTSQYWANSN